MEPRNIVLAANSRDAVQKVLMKKWSDIDLEQITPAFAERIFRESPEAQELKTKAAAILVYVLQWGGDHGHCKRPTFDYNIARQDVIDPTPRKSEPDPVADLPRQKMKEEEAENLTTGTVPVVRNETVTVITEVKPKNETSMEQKKPRGKQPKPVAQLDPKTFEVINTYESTTAASRAVGVKDVGKSITALQKSGGYYWAHPDDVESTKERIKEKLQKQADNLKAQAQKMRDRKKGTKGSGTSVPKAKVASPEGWSSTPSIELADFSDQQLKDELTRRGWVGKLERTVTMTLE